MHTQSINPSLPCIPKPFTCISFITSNPHAPFILHHSSHAHLIIHSQINAVPFTPNSSNHMHFQLIQTPCRGLSMQFQHLHTLSSFPFHFQLSLFIIAATMDSFPFIHNSFTIHARNSSPLYNTSILHHSSYFLPKKKP